MSRSEESQESGVRSQESEGRSRPFLSLCMIVKNESANLPRCLASAQPFVDEMIVVDTGSQDDTVAIAQQFGATVSTFEWCDDFAAARNFSLAQANGDWILVLDADEELVVQSALQPEHLNANPDYLAYWLQLTDANVVNDELTPLYPVRLFRNLPELRYTSRFHEQLTYQQQSLTDQQLGFFRDFKILHYGYTEDQLRTKNIQRNIPILENIRQKEGLSLMLLATLLGIYQDMGQIEKSQDCLAEAFDRLWPNLMEGTPPDKFRFVPSLLHSLGSQALERGDFDTAIIICQRGLQWCNTFPPLNHLTGELFRAMGFPLAAIAYLEYCLAMGRDCTYYTGEPFDLNFTTTYPATILGCVYMDVQRWTDAKSAFELALSFKPEFELAKSNLAIVEQVLAEHSS
ncbi:MAG TPA: glycosyltransferase [Crinalium sp.]